MEFHKQYDLRNKTIIVNKDNNKSQVDYSSISQNKNDSPIKQLHRKEDQRVESVPKNISEEKKNTNLCTCC